MKKKLALAVLIVLILGLTVVYVSILKRRLGPMGPSGPYYNEEDLLNFLEYSSVNLSDPNDVAHILEAYSLLGQEPPNKDKLFQYLNATQGADGTWNTGRPHYVPNTAHVLMQYKRYGVNPKKSLDPFLSTIDTWDKVYTHVKTYDTGNYWGGLWGYVTVYVVYKSQPPPWTSEFLNAVDQYFNTWAYDNHQRNHVAGMLYELSKPLPRKEEVLSLILQQQHLDGGWPWSRTVRTNSETDDTSVSILVLRTLFNPTDPQIASAIDKGLEFIKGNYKEKNIDDTILAGYSNLVGGEIDVPSTARAILAVTGKSLGEFQIGTS